MQELLLFRFRSGTHGLMELGRHRSREGKLEYNVWCRVREHGTVLWECSAYSSTRASFMVKLDELLSDGHANIIEKTSYVSFGRISNLY